MIKVEYNGYTFCKPSLTCECESGDGKHKKYAKCTKEATHINKWGWLMCDEHKSPTDTKLTINKEKEKTE
jgi:hypothetical protein